MARDSASGPALSSGRTEWIRMAPSPSRRPPTRSATACAVRLPVVTRLAARFELLDYALGQIQRLVGGDDSIVRRADIENHRVVPRGPHALDHTVDLGLNGVEQLSFPGCGFLLQLLGPLLQFLLLGLKVLPLGGTLRR